MMAPSWRWKDCHTCNDITSLRKVFQRHRSRSLPLHNSSDPAMRFSISAVLLFTPRVEDPDRIRRALVISHFPYLFSISRIPYSIFQIPFSYVPYPCLLIFNLTQLNKKQKYKL